MNALRSSPFLSPAPLLQVAILPCWAVLAAGADAAANALPMENDRLNPKSVKSLLISIPC